MNLADDERLLQTFLQTGSDLAFCELVNRHSDLVSRVVHKRIPDHASAEEVIQNVFALMARKAPQLAHHPALGGWLVKTAVYEAKKYHRKETTRMNRESKLTQAEIQSDASPPFTEEEFVRVETALADLTPKLRDAIILRYYNRASFASIGARLGKSEDAAQKTVSRAVERLRKLIESQTGSSPLSTSTLSAILTATLSTQAKAAATGTTLGLAALQSASKLSSSTLIANTLYTTMTATQIKTVAGLGLLIALPLAYQWSQSNSNSTPPIPATELGTETPSENPAPRLTDSLHLKELPIQESEISTSGNAVSRPSSPGINPKEHPPHYWQEREANNLIRDLSHEEWKVRRGAAALLNGSRVPAEKAVPALQIALRDEEWQVRKVVADALAYYGHESAEATLDLAEALHDEEWHVRESAAFALSKIGPEASDAAPALTATLDDEEWHVRRTSAEALAEIGPAARDAVPALTERLYDEEWQVRSPAAKALAMLGTEAAPAIEALGQALGDEEWPVVVNASAALAAIGPLAGSETGALIRALDHQESQVKQAAALALGAINPQSPEVINRLILQSADASAPVAQAAIEALEMIRQGE